jgi:hypothetical protein
MNKYITDEQVVKRVKKAVEIAIEKNKALDNPIVIYDNNTGLIYNEYPDGTQKIIGERLRKENYSKQKKGE